jgi:hypothetical protein
VLLRLALRAGAAHALAGTASAQETSG